MTKAWHILLAVLVFAAAARCSWMVADYFKHPVVPVHADHPAIAVAHLRQYFTERGLEWKVVYNPADKIYCASAFLPPDPKVNPHSYHVECADTLTSVMAAMIGDYDLDKPGYDEVLILDSGSPEQVQ